MNKAPIDIIPAVVPHSFDDLHQALEPLKDVAKRVQIDVVDGHYARGKTWPYRDAATFEKIIEEEHGLPFWDKLDFEFDLMINEPLTEVMRYVRAGASHIILHATAPGASEALQQLVELHEEGGAFSVKTGIALGAHATPDDLEPFEAQYDFVQVMGVEKEGHQGEPFDPDQKALFLVERLHRRYPTLPIQVDGGVNESNIRDLVTAGATRLAVGSAIVKAEDPAAAYRRLVDLANS
jgi:ribulose-phosphate 3-epimerase